MRETTLSIMLSAILALSIAINIGQYVAYRHLPPKDVKQNVTNWDLPTTMELQEHLQRLGYYDGEIDGRYGALTRTAHERYSNDKCGVADYRKWVRK